MAVITVDFDGTLYRGNSFKMMFQMAKKEFTWNEWMNVGQGLVKSIVVRITKGKDAFRHSFFKSFARSFKGKTEKELEDFFEGLIKQGINDIHYDLVGEIRKHQANGDHIVLLSGALQPFLYAFKKELNLDVDVISTELKFDSDGRCTGEIGTIVNGEEKVRRIVDWLSQNPSTSNAGTINNIWAYADSESDIPLLEFVNHPVVVNPGEDMRQIAEKNQWPVY
ncbi:HAD family hydrolase [Salipaludibacillus daqingensis]|uniref:HAD family hydrolase n=1 Tax=Salipaludibacillus daqingensis TaxID=3041001 RepID=UPI0024757F45|nr:HAD family hydrolase [Salipaludibacillus daqingensis]